MIAYIEQNLTGSITADDLAERAGYSPNRFREKFFNVTGETPSGYLRKRRLTEAAKELLAGKRPVDIALTYGYSSQENFTTAFRSYFGITPSELGRVDGKYRRFVRKMREAYSIMEIANLKQPPLSASIMGCIKGASDYFDNDLSAPMLYGLTGHAFLINIHTELCPSSPYVWNHDRFNKLLRSVGLSHVSEVHRTRDTPAEEVAEIEKQIKLALDEGKLCILDYMEHQLVSGYDENGLTMLQPWGDADSEVKSITYGSWEECMMGEGWAHLTMIEKSPVPESLLPAAKEALEYALDMIRNPGTYAVPGYRIGLEAYEAWLAAVEKGMGESHGHWWCATVWSECRAMASDYFKEIGEKYEGAVSSLAKELSAQYREIATLLDQASKKEKPSAEKIPLLRQAKEKEGAAIQKIEQFLVEFEKL